MQGAAFAQNENSKANSQPLPQQITQKLKDQGFTDVQVVPGSFLVSAKEKQGDPVSMIIGPHSMTAFVMSDEEHDTRARGGSNGNSS